MRAFQTSCCSSLGANPAKPAPCEIQCDDGDPSLEGLDLLATVRPSPRASQCVLQRIFCLSAVARDEGEVRQDPWVGGFEEVARVLLVQRNPPASAPRKVDA